MTAQYKDRIEEALADKERVTAVVVAAVREAVLKHKLAGNPIVCRKDGKMVWLQPDEIEV
jgi:hypothetical protein